NLGPRARRRTIRSAGFQPAVSPISNRQNLERIGALGYLQRLRIGNPRYSRLEVCATRRSLRRMGHAGFQPVVSPISNRQKFERIGALGYLQRLRIGNPRYSRLEVCATL